MLFLIKRNFVWSYEFFKRISFVKQTKSTKQPAELTSPGFLHCGFMRACICRERGRKKVRSLVYAEAILWSTNETSLLESILNSAAGSGKYSREGLSSLYVAESEAHLFTNESYILYSLWYILLSSNKGE